MPDPRRWFRAIGRIVDAPWQVAVGADLAYPGVAGQRTAQIRMVNSYLPRLHAGATVDPALAAGVRPGARAAGPSGEPAAPGPDAPGGAGAAADGTTPIGAEPARPPPGPRPVPGAVRALTRAPARAVDRGRTVGQDGPGCGRRGPQLQEGGPLPDQVPRKIILDCDPGHDDAIAMLLAHGNPDVELVAVTTVVGNHTLDNVTRNALAVATVAGITGVPFAAGCPRPLLREIQIATDIHGVTGLDGPELPEPTVPLDARHAVDLIIDTVLAHRPGEITLVPTAGLTNIALAVRKEPRLAELVREVVLMGGGYHAGNLTPVAEFNIAIDPEAAHIVFHEPWPLVMVGLDLTHQALATPAVFDAIAAVGTRPAQVVIDILEFFRTTYAACRASNHPRCTTRARWRT